MFGLTLKEKINKLTDEQVLEHVLGLVQGRVSIGPRFLGDDAGLIHGYQVIVGCGEYQFAGEPVVFDWPYQPMPIPDAFKNSNPERIN